MSAASNAERAAIRLDTERTSLARDVVDAMYRLDPTLQDRFGEEGRLKCLQDMHYNLEHLAPAVRLQAPGMFADYVRWLDDLLRARDVPTDDVRLALVAMRRVLQDRFSAHEVRSVLPCLDAGAAALADPDPDP